MEADYLYYRRRIAEELSASERAITGAGQLRHLELVGTFLSHLERLGEPLPISRADLARLKAERTEAEVS
ncbi:hypothetical protein ACUXST_002490 [Sphingomonas sp. F9_3S_D5_B_2]|jgi:hypothetical protein